MNKKWMKPNEGRLHKGNPIKSVTDAVGNAIGGMGGAVGKYSTKLLKETERAGDRAYDEVVRSSKDVWKETTNVAGRTYAELEGAVGSAYAEAARANENLQDSDWYEKMALSAAAAVQDPKALATGMVTGQLSFGTAGKKAWDAMGDAEKAEARAEHDAAMAKQEEQRLQVTEKQAQDAQAKMVKEREAEAAAEASERARRLGTGRRGLLFQGAKGKETGTKSTVLGG